MALFMRINHGPSKKDTEQQRREHIRNLRAQFGSTCIANPGETGYWLGVQDLEQARHVAIKDPNANFYFVKQTTGPSPSDSGKRVDFAHIAKNIKPYSTIKNDNEAPSSSTRPGCTHLVVHNDGSFLHIGPGTINDGLRIIDRQGEDITPTDIEFTREQYRRISTSTIQSDLK